MNIENEHLFNNALSTGINLFVGAGFSILAKDEDGNRLPLGSELSKELAAMYGKSESFSLSQIASILEATDKDGLRRYLNKRFSVKTVDPLYYNILGVNIKSIYTTNIDDLMFKIYDEDYDKFLNNQNDNGPTTDSNGINYLPLHGCVKNEESRLIFDVASLANIYNDVPRIWSSLARELEIRPTVFVGYGFGDSSVIQALTSQQTFKNARKEIWVVLRDEDYIYKEFYESLGFFVINADVKEFLSFLGSKRVPRDKSSLNKRKMDLLKPYMVPRNLQEIDIQRPIKDFYEGSAPFWCDILGNQIYKTHYVATVKDCVFKPNKNVVIIGSPVSGKTTILKQVANEIHGNFIKLFFDSISESRAEFIVKLIGDDNAIVFLDNLYDSIDALSIFESKTNIKLVCAERSHYFGIISHLVDPGKYDVINVTELSDIDLQGIYNAIPSSVKKENLQKETELKKYGKDSVFEFVIRNVNNQNIRERYAKALNTLESQDPDLAEFIVLCGYMHSCRIPLSFEMAYDYFDTFDYKSVFSLKDDASDIIKDYIPLYSYDDYKDMDYYYPRSLYTAEVIKDTCSPKLLKKVLYGVVRKIPTFRICDYKKFRKYAFDKELVLKAFVDWKEGKQYYEEAFLYDSKNPYVLQQGALYLAQKKQYDQAFVWIDKAISMTNDKYFSIRNSHAYILFNANIEKKDANVRKELDSSMQILERCMKADKRKRFHAMTYARQAIKYYMKYKYERSLVYLNQAQTWLAKEIEENSWDHDILALKDEVADAITHAIV